MLSGIRCNINWYLSVLGLLFLTACLKPEESVIKDMQGLLSQIRAQGDSISEENWEEFDNRLLELEKRYDVVSHEMTPEQKKVFNECKGKYAAIRLKSGISNFVDQFQQGIQESGQQLKGMMDEIGGDSL
jgi:hypothetical protein